MSRSRNPYIDDRAAVDHAAEDEASDDDPDATEAQIRHQDELDFQMSDIRRGHQSRLVADAPYCIPPDLLASGPATARPAQASASGTRTPLFGHDSGAPTTHDPPPFSRSQTSSIFSAPQASSSRKPPLFIPDSRDVTPYSYPGHLTPMSPAPFSPLRPSVPQASSSRNPPLFIPDSHDPTPYSYPGHLTPMSPAPFSPLRPSAPQASSSLCSATRLSLFQNPATLRHTRTPDILPQCPRRRSPATPPHRCPAQHLRSSRAPGDLPPIPRPALSARASKIGAGDIIADGSSDDPQITAGTNCWVLDWLDNLAAMNQGEEDKIIGTSAAIWVSTQDPARVPMSLGKRPPGRWLDPPCVRRHAMSPSPALCLIDRVQVRGNEVLIPFPSPPHQVGWVKGIEGNLIFVEPVDGSTAFQAELWQVRRDLRRGDSVVVVAGEYKGRQGIIVGAYWGGICEIWETKAASISEVPPQMPSSETFRARVAHVNFAVERAPEAGDYSRHVVSRHPHVPIKRAATLPAKESIQLTLAEDEAARRAEREGRMAAMEVVDPASLGALRVALERLDAREESLEHVGKRFEGIRVRVVGTTGRSHFKGKVGMVLGDFDSPERAHHLQAQKLDQQKHIRGDTNGIQVTVNEEITNAKFTVPIDQLVHDATGLPLAQAKYLPNSILFGARQVVAPAPPPRAPMPPHEQPLEDPAWVIDERDRFESFRLPGETTGEWLCCSAVAKKHDDVLLKGVKGFVRTKKMKSTAALEHMEGHIGVLMLNAPITAKSITEHKVDVYRIGPPAGPQNKREPVPATCLRPLQVNADGTSIITTQQRVVILGADVDGAEGAVGSYGQTRPEIPQDHGEHFVAVKVVGYSRTRVYHVLRLCRSLNETVYCATGDYPPTVF
ncbi:hypothetical protein FB451DRAFT_1194980 [Mycena latifolia]|nr:hypothetical protein FB451DRAFT_1194980 [Mycena latifolia]